MTLLEERTDDELVQAFKLGDLKALDHLVCRYSSLIYCTASIYYAPGLTLEDFVQHGKLGLWHAAQTYEPGRKVQFSFWAKRLVTFHIITAVKAATRKKQAPLNEALSFFRPSDGPSRGSDLQDTIEILSTGHSADPCRVVIRSMERKDLEASLKAMLTSLEWKVLQYRLKGYSYEETARRLDIPVKSVDNAMCRIKRKVEASKQCKAAARRLRRTQ